MLITQAATVINFGGTYDKTKATSPDLLKISKDKYYLYYVGTNCLPTERKGYRLLVAESKDGRKFNKIKTPILNIGNYEDKHYSPRVVRNGDKYFLYYALGSKGVYIIKVTVSKNPLSFSEEKSKICINIAKQHSAAVHTPKVFIDKKGVFHCYYTGSKNAEKVFSKRFPEYEFANKFNIYHATSKDGINFTQGKKVNLKLKNIVNFYGHNVLYSKNKLYLIFTAFDGSINRLYITESKDLNNFLEPKILLEPDENKNELGLYSNSFTQIDKNKFMIFYGVRYFDNHWKILSRILEI